jgi:hypothetical protein
MMIFAPDGAPTRINNDHQFAGGASAPNKTDSRVTALPQELTMTINLQEGRQPRTKPIRGVTALPQELTITINLQEGRQPRTKPIRA